MYPFCDSQERQSACARVRVRVYVRACACAYVCVILGSFSSTNKEQSQGENINLTFISFFLAVPSAATVYLYQTVSYIDIVAAMVHSTEQEQRYFKTLFLFQL